MLNSRKSVANEEAFRKRIRRAVLDRTVLLTKTGHLEPHINWLNGPFDYDRRFIDAARKGNRLAMEALDDLIVKRLAEGGSPSPELADYAADILRHGKPK